MKKFCSLLAGGALFALASTAFAGQPLQLTDRQLDGVTAGAAAVAGGIGFAFGDVSAYTVTTTFTNASSVTPKFAFGNATSTSVAASFVLPAVSVSGTTATASVP